MTPPPRRHWAVQKLRPGMFIYHQSAWWFTITAPMRTKMSSWHTLTVIGAEGQIRQQFRLHETTVPVTFEPPETFTEKSIADRIARRQTRIKLWQKEITDLEGLQNLLLPRKRYEKRVDLWEQEIQDLEDLLQTINPKEEP